MIKLLINNITMKFQEILTKNLKSQQRPTRKVFVYKIQVNPVLQETTFFHDRVSNRKTGKTASADFIHEILSNLVQVLRRNGLKRANGQTKGRLYTHPSKIRRLGKG